MTLKKCLPLSEPKYPTYEMKITVSAIELEVAVNETTKATWLLLEVYCPFTYA